MASAEDLHESKVTGGLDLAVLLTIGLEGRELGALEGLVAGPLELVGPSLVAKPVADEVSIASVDENGDLLQDTGHKKMEWLHPVALEEEVAVDIKVAAVVAIHRLHSESSHNVSLVEILVNVAQAGIAEAAALAVDAHVVRVATRLLVGSEDLVVAVDRGRHAAEPALAFVAAADHGLAARQGVVHGLALAFTQDSIVATFATSHGAVVRVLAVGISQAVADQDGLKVDIAVLVRENLGGENGNVVAGVTFTSNVEVLLSILREFLEEQRQQRINILAGSSGVADGVATVGVANVDGLVKEDDGGIAVPGIRVVLELDVVIDGRRAELEEETRQRGAAGAAVEPENDRIVFGVISRFEEPCQVVC